MEPPRGNEKPDLWVVCEHQSRRQITWIHTPEHNGPFVHATDDMRILGIDPGLLLTGYGCVELSGHAIEPTLVEAGVFRLKPRAALPFRLRQLHDDLCGVLDELQPRVMAVEKLFATYVHPRTPILMGHARGVVLLAAQLRNIEVIELSATAVKKAITGNGHASKRQMQEAIRTQCGLDKPPSPPDVADAIGIALCAARRFNGPHRA